MNEWSFRLQSLADVSPLLADGSARARSRPPQDISKAVSVSVLCEAESHEGTPWLFGTFEPSPALLKQGKVWWSMHLRYPTQDGYWVPLSDGGSMTSLIGNEVVDWEKLAPAEQHELSDRLRAKYSLRCQLCGFSLPVRSESVQLPLNILFSAGRREVQISDFARAIHVARRSTAK